MLEKLPDSRPRTPRWLPWKVVAIGTIATVCSVFASAALGSTPRIDTRVIDPAIGLIDVRVESEHPLASASARFFDVLGDERRVPLTRRPGEDKDGRVTYGARIGWAVSRRGTLVGAAVPPETLELTFETTTRGGDAVTSVAAVELGVPPAPGVPTWALGRVWYQVFPERFANGEAQNDPDEFGATTLPWTAPWFDVAPIEIEAAWNRRASDPAVYRSGPSTNGGAFDGVVVQRRYGGDLAGVVERLDWMQELGVDGLYLCPVFASRSLHKYDARDHRHVDPAFGPAGSSQPDPTFIAPEDPYDQSTWGWTEADRLLLDVVLPEARARGMAVVLDGVWNHVGLDHWAFRDVVDNGSASRFADWFDVRFDDDGNLVGWGAWDGTNGSLPEFEQIAGDLSPGAKRHVFAVTRRWMDPNGDGDPSDGIDGWRLDVAAEVGRAFWEDWRALVRSINPDALIVGEVWFDADSYFDGTAFDAQMHYPFAFAAARLLSTAQAEPASAFVREMELVSGRRPAVDLAQYTLLASHDTERVASLMMNPRARNYDAGAGREDVWVGMYDAGDPTDAALERSVLAAALQATWPGSPMIYGGDELGLPGADDPSNRIPIDWRAALSDPRAGDVADRYASWLGLRHHPRAGVVLRFGDLRPRPGGRRVLAYERTLNGASVGVALNVGDRPARLTVGGAPDEWLRGGSGLPQTGDIAERSAAAWLRVAEPQPAGTDLP
jgi:cyclomaltodextrinase